MNGFLRVAWVVVKKDLTVEVRSLEILSTTMFFAVTVVLMFSFGLVVDGRPLNDVAAAILWVAIAFSGTLALGRTFERERHNDTLRALLLGLVELVLVPLVGLLFNAPVIAQAIPLAGLVILGTLGFAAVGTLFAAMLVRARSRDVLLPIMLYPMTVPVMIAGVRGTAALFQPTPDPAVAQFWLALLAAFDVVFVILALWTFEPVMTE